MFYYVTSDLEYELDNFFFSWKNFHKIRIFTIKGENQKKNLKIQFCFFCTKTKKKINKTYVVVCFGHNNQFYPTRIRKKCYNKSLKVSRKRRKSIGKFYLQRPPTIFFFFVTIKWRNPASNFMLILFIKLIDIISLQCL